MQAAGHGGQVSEAELPLFTRFPELREALPYVRLSRGPTPVSRLHRFAQAAGAGETWIKNDGLYGTVYGGNKPRKLEFVLADAVQKGARTVITAGALGTNHGVAAALYGRELGLHVVLLLTYEQPDASVAARLCRMQEAGASLHYTRSIPWTALVGGRFLLRYTSRNPLRLPYLMAPGASTPLGILGYVNAGLELAEQVERRELPRPGTVVLPAGTGGTAAGLALGLRLARLDSRVVAVAVTRAPTASGTICRALAGSAGRLLRRRGMRARAPTVRPQDLTVVRDWLRPGYGRPSAAGEDAKRLLLETEGIQAESVYTAKALAALIDLQRRGALAGPVLYWHTYDAISPPAPELSPADCARLPAELRRFCTAEQG